MKNCTTCRYYEYRQNDEWCILPLKDHQWWPKRDDYCGRWAQARWAA